MSLKPVSKDGIILNQYAMSFENSNKALIDCDWIDFYQVLNSFIVKELKLSEDKQVGQFFIKFGENSKIKIKRQSIINCSNIYGKIFTKLHFLINIYLKLP